jgi:uncharacterized protein YihD (DUF1040 family)
MRALFSVSHSRNHLHHVQYVAKLEEIVGFQSRMSRLTTEDLTVIWDSQVRDSMADWANADLPCRLANTR